MSDQARKGNPADVGVEIANGRVRASRMGRRATAEGRTGLSVTPADDAEDG